MKRPVKNRLGDGVDDFIKLAKAEGVKDTDMVVINVMGTSGPLRTMTTFHALRTIAGQTRIPRTRTLYKGGKPK